MNKRLYKELQNLIIQQSQNHLFLNDYIIHFDDENTNMVYALIKAPKDSVYIHKFIRLDLKIPTNYPYSPPEVTFVNHDSVRIHPNMYENGKCCSTILNTWGDNQFEKWTSSMGIETILLTFHSFLDNNPYTYEPGGRDDITYTTYVKYQSWHSCLLRYLQFESIPLFVEMITSYLLTNINSIFNDLDKLIQSYPPDLYWTRCFEIEYYTINYEIIKEHLIILYNYIDNTSDKFPHIKISDILNNDYTCNICFDTEIYDSVIPLNCNHSFHENCIKLHCQTNQNLCPMCRTILTNSDLNNINLNIHNQWIVNPQSKRKVKIGSKTWKYLRDNHII